MLKLRFLALALLAGVATMPAAAQTRPEIERTMKRATTFMVDKVSTNGGYVWSYLPDMSRRWGEIEATPTMVWVQPPGTATMGHLYLDAYHATGDEYYYQAAEKVAGALVRGQHRSGGWNYFIDFGGPAATRHWYETVGKNAWRMEEFQHYADNSTFDDMGTSEAAQFLLRIYVEKQDPRYRPALEKAVNFVLESQYPVGGWPQRWPYDPNYPAYQSYITFNDDVAAENVKFLLMAYQHLGDTRALDAITRGMNVYLLTQQGAPQAGWALQYTLDLKPAAARTYEPNALHTGTTASNVEQLMEFYRMTGDGRFLAGIPAALDWLDSVRLPEAQGRNRLPTFVELGSNRPIYVHRRGSNVANGEYYWDYSPEATLGHYSAFRTLDVAKLRREYEALKALPAAEATRNSPLLTGAKAASMPRYFVSGGMVGSDLNAGADAGSARDLIRSLNAQGWWPTPLQATSNPYRGDGSPTPVPGDYRTTRVGDATDTSPFITETPVIGISTATYMANMAKLIQTLQERR